MGFEDEEGTCVLRMQNEAGSWRKTRESALLQRLQQNKTKQPSKPLQGHFRLLTSRAARSSISSLFFNTLLHYFEVTKFVISEIRDEYMLLGPKGYRETKMLPESRKNQSCVGGERLDVSESAMT